MIIVGVDVQKCSFTAVAVDEVGRSVAELTVGSARELVAWSASFDRERLWAVEDCRQLSGALERALLSAGESLVRVPPKLMAPQRRTGRARGKSDPIDALAVARAELRELDPELTVPPGGLDRTVWLDRVARRLRGSEQTVQVRIARELVGRCRS